MNKCLLYAQSLNVIDNRKLRDIFLMLRQDLKDSDIPSRTTITTRIKEKLSSHFQHLQEEISVCTVL